MLKLKTKVRITMPSPDRININTAPKHHYIRTIVSSLFGFLALALIIISILVVWVDHTVTNTDAYTKTVSPLVSDPDIQAFVVDRASSALLDNSEAPIRDIATELLGADVVARSADGQLKAAVTPIIKDSLTTVVSSSQFATLWSNSNREIHAQLISQLKGSAPNIQLNFHPLIVGAINQLAETKLGFIKDKLDLKADVGTVSVQGDQLEKARKVYDYFQKAMIAIIALAILCLTLCLIISVHHVKTARRIALMTGIFAALLASALSATSLVKPSGTDVAQQKFALALVDGITHDLRIILIVIAVVGIGSAIGSKLYTIIKAKRSSTVKKS